MDAFPVRTSRQLGAILRGYRRERKLTQKSVGLTAGLRQSALSQLESDPGPSSLDRIFRVLSALDLELVVRRRGGPAGKAEW